MMKCLWGLLIVMVSINGYCGIFEDVAKLKDAGEFRKAAELIDKYLTENSATVSQPDKKKLLFEKDLFGRIRLDFTDTEEVMITNLKKRIKDFQPAEFYEWDNKGYFDKKCIDGTTYYLDSNISNLFFVYEDLYNRAINWRNLSKEARERLANVRNIIKEYESTKTELVKKSTITISLTLTIDKNIIPEGKIVRYWMPYPIEIPRQKDIELIETSTAPKKIVTGNSDIGYIYLEQEVVKDQPVVFTEKFRMTTYAFYQLIDYKKVEPYDPNDATYKKYIQLRTEHETPLPEFKELVKTIVGKETNPYLKAKKIYEWLPTYIKYGYCPEYSTIDNLTKYIYERKRGDCGVQALWFMTLCKIAGVPTRWQSGWTTDGTKASMHDWCEMYIKPYGWLPG